jgi:trk system potassium uptake protein TrkA
MRISLGGSGQPLLHVTKALISKGYSLNIICPDPALCDLLAREFRAEIICGDPTDFAILSNAGIGDSQIVVAVLPEDADNYVLCQLARGNFQVARTVTLVHNPVNEAIFKQMGIQVTLSLANVISSLVEGGLHEEVTNLHSLENGKILAMLLRISAKSPLLGKKRQDIPVVTQARLGPIIRDGVFLDDHLPVQINDQLLVYVEPLAQGQVIREYLGVK